MEALESLGQDFANFQSIFIRRDKAKGKPQAHLSFDDINAGNLHDGGGVDRSFLGDSNQQKSA